MSSRQASIALRRPCLLSVETSHPRYAERDPSGYKIVLTVDTGYG